MSVADRLRAVRWVRPAIGVTAAGLVVVIAAWAVSALSARGDPLNADASRAVILGTGVAVAGSVASVALWARAKLAGDASPLSPRELLRRRVVEYEQAVRRVLLSGLTPADLAFTSGDARARQSPSPAEDKNSLRFRRLLNGLLRFDKGDPGDASEGELTGIGDYYRGLRARGIPRLLILGEPGSGKTVLAIELILQLLRPGAAGTSPDSSDGKVPVRFSIAGWAVGTDLPRWLAERLVTDYGMPETAAAELVAGRLLLPVLDGLDEMDPEPGDPARSPGNPAPRAAAFLTALNDYADLDQPGSVVLTCRLETYQRLQAAGATLAAQQQITIRPLDSTRIRDYLHARYPDPANPRRHRWDQVLRQLERPEGAVALSVLSTPWRLLLAVTAAEAGQDPAQILAAGVGEDPATAAARIDQALLAAYIPAATRLTIRRGKLGIRPRRYDTDKAERWLRSLARHLQWQAEQVTALPQPPVGMSGIDLVPHLLWPIGGPRLVRALHTGLALLLATAAVVTAAYAVIGPPAVWLSNIHDVLAGDFSLPVTIGKTFSALGPPAVVLYISVGAATAWPSALSSVRSRAPRSRRLASALAVGLAGGLAAGLAITLAVGLATGLAIGLAIGLAFALAGGFTGAMYLAFSGESWAPEADLPEPYYGIRREGLSAAAYGLASGLAIALTAGLAIGLARGFAFALAGGIGGGIATGLAAGDAWIRYMIGVTSAAVRGRLPFRLRSFVTWACDSGLLRVAGTAYQFRHRELQAWLTSQMPRLGPRVHAP